MLLCRAFCNPADVEAFTEEKKQSLLIKRQGKGADFVRAVQEIIESYENSKKQEQVEPKSADEVPHANGGNSMDPLPDSAEASAAALALQSKGSDSSKAIEDQNLSAENASAGNGACEQLADNLVAKETPTLTTYTSRKRSGGLRSQKSTKAASCRKSRSSLRVESYQLRNFIAQCNGVSQSAADVSTKVIRDGALRRNKRIGKSPGASEWNDVDSSVLMSNGSIEDNSSEIATVDSDNISLHEGSTIDSDCKLEHSDTVVECLEGDVELSKGLDFQIKAVVIKKKRKPSRKRVGNDAAEPPTLMDVDADLDLGVRNSCQTSQNSFEHLEERFPKENGDEHLPLVKRARVRMSKPSSNEEACISSQAEKKPLKEVPINMPEQMSPLLNGEEENRAHGDSCAAIGATDNVPSPKISTQISDDIHADVESKRALTNASPSKDCKLILENRPQPWRIMKNQFSSADGEAALPPSKRLQRAMEAMSANAAEEGQACVEVLSTLNRLTNESCVPSTRCSQMTNEKGENVLGLGNLVTLANSTSEFSSSSKPMILEKSSKTTEEQIQKQAIQCCKSQKNESCEDVVSTIESMKGKDCCSVLDACTVQTQNSQHFLPSNQDEKIGENVEVSINRAGSSEKEPDTLRHAEISLNCGLPSNEIAKVSPEYGTECVDCATTKSLKSQVNVNSQVNSG